MPDCLSLSFKLQELLQPTSSQDCSTGEQTPGALWSCPSLERFDIVIAKLGKVLESLPAALPVLPAVSPAPREQPGRCWGRAAFALVGHTCRVALPRCVTACSWQCCCASVCRLRLWGTPQVLGPGWAGGCSAGQTQIWRVVPAAELLKICQT